MPIAPSKDYAAVHNGIVKEKGNAKNMRRLARKNGGYRKGWSVFLSPNSKVGDRCR